MTTQAVQEQMEKLLVVSNPWIAWIVSTSEVKTVSRYPSALCFTIVVSGNFVSGALSADLYAAPVKIESDDCICGSSMNK